MVLFPRIMLKFWNSILCMNQHAMSFNLICHIQFSDFPVFSVFRIFRPIRKRKSGFLGTVGILRSSPIRGYPYHICRYPNSAAIDQNGRKRYLLFFVISGRSGNGNPDFLVPLESLGQARSAGTSQMSVGAPVEAQWGKTGKPVFRL